MDTLLQTFDTPFTDSEGAHYDVRLYGRSRPGDTWQGWLMFVRRSDGLTLATDVETTQPSAEQVLYWGTGLTGTFFDGAFERARRAHQPVSAGLPAPAALRNASIDRSTYLARLTALEREILRCFTDHAATQLATQVVLDALPHAHADVVRGLEALEKQSRYLVRKTENGTDWLILTEEGLAAAGVSGVPHTHGVAEVEPR